jgi:hypothetical protein
MPFPVYPQKKIVGYGVSTSLGNILAVSINENGSVTPGFQYSTNDGVTWQSAADDCGIYVDDWVWNAAFGFVAIGRDTGSNEPAIEVSDDLVNWTRVNTNFSDGPVAAIVVQQT